MPTQLYLSAHLDDAVLSCGALIHRQRTHRERVIVLTVCAGDAPATGLSSFAQALHTRWQTAVNAVAIRRDEDIAAVRSLGAEHIHLNIPDCIYRAHPETGTPLYASEAALFGEWDPAEFVLARKVARSVFDLCRITRATQVYVPLAIGRHVDHQLTRRAAELSGLPLAFYEDYPYTERASEAGAWGGLAADLVADWVPISELDVEAQARAVAAYHSQLSTFWPDEAEMRMALTRAAQRAEAGRWAIRLWYKPS
jgi:LmbE family N-acetylglucosaminyl deacetylase